MIRKKLITVKFLTFIKYVCRKRISVRLFRVLNKCFWKLYVQMCIEEKKLKEFPTVKQSALQRRWTCVYSHKFIYVFLWVCLCTYASFLWTFLLCFLCLFLYLFFFVGKSNKTKQNKKPKQAKLEEAFFCTSNGRELFFFFFNKKTKKEKNAPAIKQRKKRRCIDTIFFWRLK